MDDNTRDVLMAALVVAAIAILGLASNGCTDSLASTAQALATTPWTRHTIAADLVGADGHALGDVDHDGDADVAVAWEESSKVTVYARPPDPRVTPWPLVASYAHSSAEDVTLCDLDADGWLDLVSAGEDRRIRVARNLGGTFGPAVVAVNGVQQWTQVTCGGELGELVAGGRIAVAGQALGIYALHSATPWVAASWSRELLGPAGWTLSLVLQDVDGDGLTDVLTSDRLQAAPLVQGVRYLTRASGAWASVWLAPVAGGYMPRFVDRRWGSGRLLVGSVRESDQTSTLTLDGVALPYPTGLGVYQAGRLVDVDADGREDVVLTSGEAGGVITPASSSGVVWLRAPTWDRREVSGPGGGKWDEVDTLDVDADGDLDVVSTEQRNGWGVVWYEQP